MEKFRFVVRFSPQLHVSCIKFSFSIYFVRLFCVDFHDKFFSLSLCANKQFFAFEPKLIQFTNPHGSRGTKKTAFSSTKFAINIIELFSMNSFSIGCSRWIIFHVKKVFEAMIKLSPRRLGIEGTFCQIDSPVAGYISPRQKQGCHYLWLLPIKLKQRASSSLKSEKTPSGSTT